MRKELVASVLLSGILVGGCGGQTSGAGADSPGAGQPPEPPAQPQPSRAAPAKQVEIADQCSVVPDQKKNELGLDQPPRPRQSNGKPGCQYQAGKAGSSGGWGAFVAADPSRTMQQFSQSATGPGREENVSGYPVHLVDSGPGCLAAVDVSDSGSLFINTLVRPGPDRAKFNACEQAKSVAEAAVQTLPNA